MESPRHPHIGPEAAGGLCKRKCTTVFSFKQHPGGTQPQRVKQRGWQRVSLASFITDEAGGRGCVTRVSKELLRTSVSTAFSSPSACPFLRPRGRKASVTGAGITYPPDAPSAGIRSPVPCSIRWVVLQTVEFSLSQDSLLAWRPSMILAACFP